MIYFVHGPDRLLARQAVLAIRAEIDPDDANTTWLDGRETRIDQVINAVGAASFFGAPRVVIVSDILSRAARGASGSDGGSADDDRSASEQRAIGSLLSAVPEQNVLILFEPALSAPPAAIKTAKPPVTTIAGEPPRGPALVGWIENAAHRAGARIDRRSAQSLAETLFPQTWDRKPANPRYDRPPDMALLSHEIEKLALAAHPDAISRQHIVELVPGGPDQRVFRFLDAAITGDLSAATGELERLAAAGEEPAMLLAQLLGQVELTTVATAAAGRDAGSVARDLGAITPARMSAVMSSAQRRRIPTDESVMSGVAVDRNLKTGRTRNPENALLDMVLALASPTPTRKTGRSL